MAGQALEGIRVLDLTQIMAGPFSTLLLADLGAEVIKIERPQGGDDARHQGFRVGDDDSLSFIAMNRNKLGLAVDIRRPEGQAIMRRLIATADVLVENFRPGTLDRLGLGYEDARRIRPDIIYCSVSGFGQTGPWKDRGGFDLVAQAMGGIISVTGTPQHPAKSGVPLSDLNAGLFASHAILAALFHRARTGEGQRLDTSLLEGAIAYTFWESNEYWATGKPPQGLGTAHRNSAPYQTFPTQDGSIAIGAANQRNWERLAEAIGRPELLEDPRFVTNAGRLQHRAELAETLTETFRRRTTAEWMKVLEEAGVPAGPVLDIGQMYAHPQVRARQMEYLVEHPTAGTVHQIGPAVKYSRTPARIRRPAPLLGQHTFAILKELGYSDEECAALEAAGVVRDAHYEGPPPTEGRPVV
jgi:crotonobetainyl-CoA:carnitine CoA-transferase CaiB-like acyl-CoA transferase